MKEALEVKGFLTKDVRFTSMRRHESYGERTISQQGFVDTEPNPSSS